MSIKIMTAVWERSRSRGNDLLVLLALADWSNDDGESWPSLRQLADKARTSRQSVIAAIGRIEQLGELKIHRRAHAEGNENRAAIIGFQSTNLYQILVGKVVKQLDHSGGQEALLPGRSGSQMIKRSGGQDDHDQVVKSRRRSLYVSNTSVRNTSVPGSDRSPGLISTDSDHAIKGARETLIKWFDEVFWKTWPSTKRICKDRARRALLQLNPTAAERAAIVAGIEQHKLAPGWHREGGRYIPLPDKFIRQRRWEETAPAEYSDSDRKLARYKKPCDHTPPCRNARRCYELRLAIEAGNAEQIAYARRLAAS
jgi:hypothetical protein